MSSLRIQDELAAQIRAITGQAPTECPLGQLNRILGPAPAESLVRDVLTRAQLERIAGPQDLLSFADALLEGRGGLIEVAGRALRVEALARGARPA